MQASVEKLNSVKKKINDIVIRKQLKTIPQIVVITKTFSLNNRKQEVNLIDALKIACRKYSKEKTGKKPFTNINLVRI